MFTEEDLQTLPDDPLDALLEVCRRYLKRSETLAPQPVETKYTMYLDAYAFLVEVAPRLKDGPATSLTFGSEPGPNIQLIDNLFKMYHQNVRQRVVVRTTNERIESSRAKFAIAGGESPTYRFDQEELARIQDLIAEVRRLIQGWVDLPEQHRVRLLRRLEALQQELHETMSNADKMWTFIGELGVALRKFGDDVKPLADRARELFEAFTKAANASTMLLTAATFPLLPPSPPKLSNSQHVAPTPGPGEGA